MKQKDSSIKKFNFLGMTSNQIVKKYEKVLESRENQLTELSSEVGNMNEKLLIYSEKCTKLEEENKTLQLKIFKKSQKEVAPSLNLQHVQVDGMEGIEAGTDAYKRQISGRFVPFGSYHAVDEWFADGSQEEQGYGGDKHTGADDAAIGRRHALFIVLNTTQHRVGDSVHHRCQVLGE